MFETIMQADPRVPRNIQVMIISRTLRYLEKVKHLDSIHEVSNLIDSKLCDIAQTPQLNGFEVTIGKPIREN